MTARIARAACAAMVLPAIALLSACVSAAPVDAPPATATAPVMTPSTSVAPSAPATPSFPTSSPISTSVLDAEAVYNTCYDEIPASAWGNQPLPQPLPFDPAYVFAAHEPDTIAVNVHLQGSPDGIDLGALCYVTGDPAAPVVTFSKMFD